MARQAVRCHLQIVHTSAFRQSLFNLSDIRAQSRVVVAVERMAEGNLGDCKAVGSGVFETRLHFGPGYRGYFARRGAELVVLLLCGAKPTQQADIHRAIALNRSL